MTTHTPLMLLARHLADVRHASVLAHPPKVLFCHRNPTRWSLLRFPGLTRPDVFRFAPLLGRLELRLNRIARQLAISEDRSEFVKSLAAVAFDEATNASAPDVRSIAWAFSLSVLSDILAAGGTVQVNDSAVMVSWPDWSSKEGERGLRQALNQLRNETRQPIIGESVLEGFAGSMQIRTAATLLMQGDVSLKEGHELHPSGSTYNQIFAAAATYWTMPVRDREGRNRRFVVTIDHATLPAPVAAAIIEVGDGAPLSAPRDELLGLTTGAFKRWLVQVPDRREALRILSRRLAGIAEALLPIPGTREVSTEVLYGRLENIEEAAGGRSHDSSTLAVRKRLAYLARITRARKAVSQMERGEEPLQKDIYAIVRLLRDLAIPRLHLELTICGGLPPFSPLLAGKLAIAFIADPRIVDICKSPIGDILRSVFDPQQLTALLPENGAVLISTKGLFAEHSAQYTRATVPSLEPGRPIGLRKIGLTSGVTASLMSRRSYQLAQVYLKATKVSGSISDEFGSGGSKRQRRIEAVVRHLGMPDGLIYPRLRRPIYAVSLVDNLADVAILNAPPQWRSFRGNVADYGSAATSEWRSRWGATIERRLCEPRMEVGVRDWLARERTDA
jgi:hypothetical protein